MPDFHPEIRRAARLVPRTLVTPTSVPLIRAATKVLLRNASADVEDLTLASGVGVRLHRPPGVTGVAPALLWIHGGGYVIGTPNQDDALLRRFARALGVTIAAVRYRLAPEHPYPAGLDDCYAALTWLASLPAVDAGRVAIGGASAGGGLAAALAQLAHDRGEVDVAAQLLVYPMLDDRSATAPGLDDPHHRMWTQKANGFGWSSYLRGADPNVAVPARRKNLGGLPPAWIGVGTLDLFHDEDVAYAERLRAARVPCDLETVPGVFHGFDGVIPKSDVVKSFFTSQVEFLRRTLAPNVSPVRIRR